MIMENITDPIPVVEEAQPLAPLSVTDKFVGILTEPSAVFTNLRLAGSRSSDWIVPLVVLVIIAMAAAWIKLANPQIFDQIKTQQREQLESMAKSGRMPAEAVDQQIEFFDKNPILLKIGQVFNPVIVIVLVLFAFALVAWLAGKYIFKAAVTYSLMLAVIGLTLYTDIIGQIVNVVVAIVAGNFYSSLSLGLLLPVDLKSWVFRLAMTFDPISVWGYVLIGMGFRDVAQISSAKAYGFVAAIWIVKVLWVVFLPMLFL
jgi:hypothetical protein